MATEILICQLGERVPAVGDRFAVLLDADEFSWGDAGFRTQRTRELLAAGCRYFVCIGANSERLHDCVDDEIVDGGYEDVVTTFHTDESPADVLGFFAESVVAGVNRLIVLVEDLSRWTALVKARLIGEIEE